LATAGKQCSNCGKLSSSKANYCASCGHDEFSELPRTGFNIDDGETNNALIITATRVLLVSILSGGLYFSYWGYLTWKQLASETEETHFPIAHGLSFFVPILGLITLYRHVVVTNTLANGVKAETYITPAMAMVLGTLLWVLAFTVVVVVPTPGIVILMSLVSLVVTTTITILNQATLNGYWLGSRGEQDLKKLPVGMVEMIVVVLGLLNWISVAMSG